MKAFLCVYRHPIISERDVQKVQDNAAHNQDLQLFLRHYFQPGCNFDWGDDPSFFQAIHRLGDPRLASWGVCRPNVRRQLQPGDLVIFLCGAEGAQRGIWDYFYIGYGTVQHSLQREEVYTNAQFATYRPFFNMISRWENGHKHQEEEFESEHDNYDKRCAAGYILFHPEQTDFNLTNPLPVAHYNRGEIAERWHLTDPLVSRLQHILFLDGTIDRTLNSGNWRRPHVHIPIHTHLEKVGRLEDLTHLRPNLSQLSADIRRIR